MTTRLALLSLLAFAAFAAPAGAATVSQTMGPAYADSGDLGGCGHYMQCGTKRTVNVLAAPGERNSISAELADQNSPFGDLIVSDFDGGPLEAAAGSNCAVTGPSEVTCATPPPPLLIEDGARLAEAVIALGDGNDSVKAGLLPVTAYGGPGADKLHGGPRADYLDGGPGRDWLIGGKGRDALLGRAGADRLSARDGQRDRVSCGSGRSRDRAIADRKDKISGCEQRTP